MRIPSTALLGVLIVTLSRAFAQWYPPLPEGISFKKATFSGVGCSEQSAAAVLDYGRGLINITFTNYTAAIGPSVPSGLDRAACEAQISMQVPANYHFWLQEATFTGSVDMEKGVTGQIKSTHFFNTSTSQVSQPQTITCP